MLYRDYLKSKYQNTAVKLANAEGVPCVLEYSKGKNIRNYEVCGNSVQSGTPSPESPVEIQSVGDLVTDTESEYYGKYDVPVTVTGKNLFDKSISTNANIKNETTITNTAYSLPVLKTNAICNILKPNTTYTISCEFECTAIPSEDEYTYSDGILGFMIYTSVSGYSSKTVYITKQMAVGEIYQFSRTFTTPEIFDTGGNYGFLIYRNKYTGKSTIAASMICRNIQIEEASSATAYEPYKGSETTHIYLDEPLRKVGDYADYIDFKNQKVVRNILKQSLNAYNIYKKLNSVIRIGGLSGRDIKHKLDSHILSTIFNYNLGWNIDTESIFHHTDAYYNYYWSVYWSRLGLAYDGTNVYRADDTSQTPLTDKEIISIANEWLSTLPDGDKEVYIIIDTPTEESISLPALKTFKGTNVMSVDTSIQPSNIKAKYIRT